MDPVLPGHRLAEPLGGKNPFDRQGRQGKRFWGNNRQMQRQPAKFNHDHLHHSGGNQVILLQKLRFLLWISITQNYISTKINIGLGGDLWIPNEWTDNSRDMAAACSGGLSHLLHNRKSISDCLKNLLISTWRKTCESIQAQTMKDASQAKMLQHSRTSCQFYSLTVWEAFSEATGLTINTLGVLKLHYYCWSFLSHLYAF